jgi:hypothetical protein
VLLKPPQLIIPALHCQSLFCLSNGSVSKRSKERSLQGRGVRDTFMGSNPFRSSKIDLFGIVFFS